MSRLRRFLPPQVADLIVASGSEKQLESHRREAALDSVNGHATMTILSAIAKERGRAVLVVTHDPRLFEFADRIVHIQDGSLTREQSTGPNMNATRNRPSLLLERDRAGQPA